MKQLAGWLTDEHADNLERPHDDYRGARCVHGQLARTELQMRVRTEHPQSSRADRGDLGRGQQHPQPGPSGTHEEQAREQWQRGEGGRESESRRDEGREGGDERGYHTR